MKIYLDENELEKEYQSLSLPELLNSVKSNLQDKIINRIFINDVEVNEKYLEESLVEKTDIEEIKFTTRDTKDLIQETLNEIERYLPILKKGMLDTADLFRMGNTEEASTKYQQVLEGIEWYLQSTSSILNIIGNKKTLDDQKETIDKFNKLLGDIMVAYKKDDFILVADMLEYEMVEYIDDFIEFNENIRNNLKNPQQQSEDL